MLLHKTNVVYQLSDQYGCASISGWRLFSKMLSKQVNSETGATQIVVRANKSMSWRANVFLAASLGGLSAIFGAVIASAGFWMVLPFAGLEFLFVYVCLSKAYKRLGYTEVISMQRECVTIESGYDKPVHTEELPSEMTRVQFDDPVSAFEVGRLSLQCGGRNLEIGQALSKEEKRMLHKEVMHCLALSVPNLRLVN